MKINFISDAGSGTSTNSLTLESIQSLLSATLDPLNSRLDRIESRRQEPLEIFNDDGGPYDMSFDSTNHSSSETEDITMTASTNPWYILPRSALVGSTHIEVDDYCLSHTGTNPMVDLGSRNGRHVIRVLRNIPSVVQVLSLCRLESEVESEAPIPNMSFIKAPFNSTLQKELGWKV